jgi:type IV pilus assembly protein PilV
MLEAMVAIVVLSLGLLGVAALQMAGLRNNSSANMRAQAAWYAEEMIEEARGRRSDVLAGSTNVIGAMASFSCSGVPGTTSSLDAWRARIACALPSGQGSVTFDSNSRRMTVRVQWDDSRGANGVSNTTTTPQTFTLETMI